MVSDVGTALHSVPLMQGAYILWIVAEQVK